MPGEEGKTRRAYLGILDAWRRRFRQEHGIVCKAKEATTGLPWGGKATEVHLAFFDIDRMGWEEGDLICGLTVVGDARWPPAMRVTCDAEPDGGNKEEEEVEEVVDAVSSAARARRPGSVPAGPKRPVELGRPDGPTRPRTLDCAPLPCAAGGGVLPGVAVRRRSHVARHCRTRRVAHAPARRALAKNALGLPAVLFCIVTGAAPLAAMMFNVPIAVLGGGYAVPAAFLIATVVLTIFSIGYIEMSRGVTSTGGFYTFITRGLGNVLGPRLGHPDRALLHHLLGGGDGRARLLRGDHLRRLVRHLAARPTSTCSARWR